jgi:hypothetical protein
MGFTIDSDFNKLHKSVESLRFHKNKFFLFFIECVLFKYKVLLADAMPFVKNY